jgi:hypothetical protein
VLLYSTLTLPTKVFAIISEKWAWLRGALVAIGIGQKFYKFSYNSIVSFVPRQAGVYVLLNASWFYIGESDDLVEGLLEHLLGQKRNTTNGDQPSTFQFEVVLADEQRKTRLSQLSQDFQASASK